MPSCLGPLASAFPYETAASVCRFFRNARRARRTSAHGVGDGDGKRFRRVSASSSAIFESADCASQSAATSRSVSSAGRTSRSSAPPDFSSNDSRRSRRGRSAARRCKGGSTLRPGAAACATRFCTTTSRTNQPRLARPSAAATVASAGLSRRRNARGRRSAPRATDAAARTRAYERFSAAGAIWRRARTTDGGDSASVRSACTFQPPASSTMSRISIWSRPDGESIAKIAVRPVGSSVVRSSQRALPRGPARTPISFRASSRPSIRNGDRVESASQRGIGPFARYSAASRTA